MVIKIQKMQLFIALTIVIKIKYRLHKKTINNKTEKPACTCYTFKG